MSRIARSLLTSLGFLFCLAHQAAAVPAYVLQLPPSVQTLLIAETSTSTLHRFVVGKSGLRAAATSYMSIGERGVGKQRAWDRRTPLGIYFISEQLDTSRLHKKYGPTAFPLDYPNAWDRRERRGGDGIWIHGVIDDAGRRPPLDTDGCIALPNDALLALEPHLVPWQTPVIVTRELAEQGATQRDALRRELLEALDAWADSLKNGDWHRYFSMYDAGFRYRGLSRDDWQAYRLRAAASRPLDELLLDEVLLLADPETDGLFLSRFVQTIEESGQQLVVRKRLYWRRDSEGELRIVAEDNG